MRNGKIIKTKNLILLVVFATTLSMATQAFGQATLFGLAHPGFNAPSTLYSIDPTTGAATLIGATTFNECSGMDYHDPSGTMYATCERNDGSNTHVLITIDLATGEGTLVDTTEVGRATNFFNDGMDDISFRNADNMLYAYFSPQGDVGTVNIATGKAALLGLSGSNTSGHGIAFSPGDVLFHGNNLVMNTLNQTGGAATIPPVGPHGFPPGANVFPRINAMDFHPGTGALFVSLKNGLSADNNEINFLATSETMPSATGDVLVTLIGPTVDGLDAIAWTGGGGGGETSFSNFSIHKAKIKYKARSRTRDSFKIKGRFTLDHKNSNGLDLVNEPVTMMIGGASFHFPPGSFVGIGSHMVYKGTINGSPVKMHVREKYHNEFKFGISAHRVDLTGTSNPLEITLKIGDDVGTTEVRLRGKLELKNSKKFKRHKRFFRGRHNKDFQDDHDDHHDD